MRNLSRLLVVVVLAISLLLSGCSGNNGETPEQAVTNALNAVRKLDHESLKKYLPNNDLINKSENEILDDEEALKLIVDKLEFKIISSQIEGDIATVKTEITNIDFKPIFGEYIKQAMAIALSSAFSGEGEPSDEEMEQILINLLDREDNTTITSTVDVKLTKNETSWVLDMNETLQDAIFGGIVSASKEMEKGFGAGTSQLEQTPEDKLREISNYVVGDIWNDGFCDIKHYLEDGKNSIGETMDIDFTLEQLDDAMGEKAQYDSFIKNLEGGKYSKAKSIWDKLSPEIDKLYSKVKEAKPTANSHSYDLDTGLFNQYMDAFSDEVYKLK